MLSNGSHGGVFIYKATRPTIKEISGLVFEKYKRLPTNSQYKMASTLSVVQVVAILTPN
jgi:hypothetical protein